MAAVTTFFVTGDYKTDLLACSQAVVLFKMLLHPTQPGASCVNPTRRVSCLSSYLTSLDGLLA